MSYAQLKQNGRKLTYNLAALAGAGMIVALSATPTYAAYNLVTMHGTACKAANPNSSNVTYGSELWTNDSAAVVICPLVNRWTDYQYPYSIGDVKVYLGSAGWVACTLYRHKSLFGNPESWPGTVSRDGIYGSWNQLVAFTGFYGGQRGIDTNNYFIMCSLPPRTALYNVTYVAMSTP